MENNKINLHMHSNYSLYGRENVNTVLDKCEEAGIKIVSITDHNTCACYSDIKDTKFSGNIIYGMEADALVGKVTYDILCYGFDLENVRKWADNQYGTVGYRQQKIFDKLLELCNECNLKIVGAETYEADKEFAHAALFRLLNETAEGRKFLADFNINSIGDLYRESTMNEDFPLFIDMHIVWPTIKEVGSVIHENGGKIFLAHPFKYRTTKVEEVLNNCVPYIDGIEIYNEPENKEEVEYLYRYAKEHDLLVTVGSDYNGNDGHDKLLVTGLTDEMATDVLSWVNGYLKQSRKI